MKSTCMWRTSIMTKSVLSTSSSEFRIDKNDSWKGFLLTWLEASPDEIFGIEYVIRSRRCFKWNEMRFIKIIRKKKF